MPFALGNTACFAPPQPATNLTHVDRVVQAVEVVPNQSTVHQVRWVVGGALYRCVQALHSILVIALFTQRKA